MKFTASCAELSGLKADSLILPTGPTLENSIETINQWSNNAISSTIESGEFTMEEVRQTLEGFNTLSDAGKALVGNEQFDATDTASGSLFSQLSDADKAIVLNNMPVVGNDQ